MLNLPADVAARFSAARINAALTELDRVAIPADARQRIDYLLQAARDGHAEFADGFAPSARPARAAVSAERSAVIIPFPRRP